MSIFKNLRKKRQERLNQIREEKRKELFSRIQKVAAKELKIEDPARIQLNSRFKEDLGVDSLSSIELMMGLEDEFGLEIANGDVEELLTIEDVVNYLENKT